MAKITYIKEGENNTSVLIVDGVQVNSSNYGVDSKIHAIQWNGSKGEIEYNDGTANKEISDISDFDFENKHAKEKKAIDDAETKRISDFRANMTYADKRREEYPEIEDQLDTIYHKGIDEWKKTIKVIKDKYPKS